MADIENVKLGASEEGAKTVDAPVKVSGFTVEGMVESIKTEKLNLGMLALLLVGCGVVVAIGDDAARWYGFALAGYSAIANDSIQTLGTFIASNSDIPWYVLGLLMSSVMVGTTLYSFVEYDGDISYERLSSKGFTETPTDIHFLQVAAPVVLLAFTRFKVPVSTSFLLLSCFASKGSAIGSMIVKSVQGYALAYFAACFAWGYGGKWLHEIIVKTPEAPKYWKPIQAVTTSLLWSLWLQQDMSNIAVFLPRKLSSGEVTVVISFLVVTLLIVFKLKGDRIQQVVAEKTEIADIRAACVVDAVYTAVLWVFKMKSKVPMSTTWVFIGLLAGRENMLGLMGVSNGTPAEAKNMMFKDLHRVAFGFLVSLAMACAVNDAILEGLFA
jgi:hypothetical protein